MATLVVTIQEEITINGKDRGNKNSIEITNVTEVFSRVLTIGNNEQTVIGFQATDGAGGSIKDGDLQYLRITNLDDSHAVNLRVQDTANTKEYFVQVAAGESFILFNDQMDCDSAAVDTTISLSQIDFISADVPTASQTADIEVFAIAD